MSMTKPTFREKVKLYWYELLALCHLLSISLWVSCSTALRPLAVFAVFALAGAAHAAGSATASDVALKGGMSIIDPTLLTAIFTGMAAVIGSLSTLMWCKHKAGKVQRPVDSDDTYVTHGECKSHRCALSKRIDEIGPALNRIFNKLNENDRKSEERSIQMHRRLDPIVERVAANSAKIEMFEDLARKATVGGNK